MEIGGLGKVNAFVSSVGQSSSFEGDVTGFAGIMSSILSGMNETSGTSSSDSTAGKGLTKEDLQDLLKFLQTDHLTNLQNGNELLDQTMGSIDVKLSDLIQHFLGMTDEQWSKMLENVKKVLSSLSNSDSKLQSTEKKQDELSPEDVLYQLMLSIAALPKDQLALTMNKDVADLMKTAKLFDLVSVHQDAMADQKDWKNVIKKLMEKLEAMAKIDGTSGRNEYLQKTFQTVVTAKLGLVNDQAKNNSNMNTLLTADAKNEQGNDLGGISKATNTKLDAISANGLILQQMSKPEQLTLTLSKAGKPVSTEQLIQQFESILSKAQLTNGNGLQRMFIKLNPEHLGAMRIELIQREQGMMARILTTTGAAKETLESQLNGLKQALAAQNIQVDRIEISQQMTQERFFNRDSQSQQHQQRQQEKNEQTHTQEDETFSTSFAEALLNTEA